MTPENWICDCLDSNIRRVDANHPHPAISRDGWFCMGCLTEFEIKKTMSDMLIRENEILASPNDDLKQLLRLKEYSSYALGIIKKLDYTPSDADSPTSLFEAELSEDWFFHVKWKLEEILNRINNE